MQRLRPARRERAPSRPFQSTLLLSAPFVATLKKALSAVTVCIAATALLWPVCIRLAQYQKDNRSRLAIEVATRDDNSEIVPQQRANGAGGDEVSKEAASPKLIPTQKARGIVTGLPVPRFASLRSDLVNMRVGPGIRYPIEWVYQRRGLPIEIMREFATWRRIRDSKGVKGWVHQSLLIRRRTFVVVGGGQVIRSRSERDSAPVAQLELGVIGRLRYCDANSVWCKVQVAGYRGWLPRHAFWGGLPSDGVTDD
jgi:SH3-like domain-containing protein